MAYKLGYNTTWSALGAPGAARDFFICGRPRSDDALCAELSRLVYADTAARNDGLWRGGFEPGQCQFFDNGGMQAMLVREGGRGLLVFRGTEPTSIEDLATDLAFLPMPAGGGMAHAGFVRGLDLLWPAIRSALSPVPTSLVYTGHSLGAALAVVAMTRLQPTLVVTIGCPRVGDAAFVAGLPKAPHRRWVDCCDIVTDLPPALAGFQQAGERRYLDHEGSFHPDATDAVIAADRELAERSYGGIRHFEDGEVPSRHLADHAPINYVSALLDLDI